MGGLAGQFGLLVVDRAEAEVRPEDERVPHLHPPTVGLTVQGRVMKGKLARFRTAVSIAGNIITATNFRQLDTRLKVMK